MEVTAGGSTEKEATEKTRIVPIAEQDHLLDYEGRFTRDTIAVGAFLNLASGSEPKGNILGLVFLARNSDSEMTRVTDVAGVEYESGDRYYVVSKGNGKSSVYSCFPYTELNPIREDGEVVGVRLAVTRFKTIPVGAQKLRRELGSGALLEKSRKKVSGVIDISAEVDGGGNFVSMRPGNRNSRRWLGAGRDSEVQIYRVKASLE
ncbi:hypothetical protein KKB40_02620 [Patescibacteria group bacterium]|nr:hypothetical protein [Patescibacteria group bacterium]